MYERAIRAQQHESISRQMSSCLGSPSVEVIALHVADFQRSQGWDVHRS